MMSTIPSFTDESQWWIGRLAFNLLGYATVAVPGALLIHWLKKTKYYEGPGLFKKILAMCVVGEEPAKPDLELGGDDEPPKPVPRSPSQEFFLLAFCFCGLQFSYLTWGVLQEKIMTKQYEDRQGNFHKFTDSQFLVFVNRVLALAFAAVYLVFAPRCLGRPQPKHTVPMYKYSYCSFSNIMSSWCQYEALKYVSFPSQVLAKTSKIIPVMLMGKLVSKKSYSSFEYITAAGISLGMTVFLLSRSSSAQSEKSTTILGVIILVGYMVFDSFTSNWQGQLFTVYRMSSVQMMCGVNLFSCLFTSVSLWQQGSFELSLSFSFVCPVFFWDCLALSVCSAAGQLFIFYTISQFGAVVFVIVMTVRQAVAILLSCIVFQHNINILGFLGIAVVFLSVFMRIFMNKKKA